MLRNYLNVSLRNIRRKPLFAWVNILGLAFGMASALIILQYVYFEYSFNTFHHRTENIYRIIEKNIQQNTQDALVPPPVAKELRRRIGEVQGATLLTSLPFVMQTQGGNQSPSMVVEEAVHFSNADFTKVFSFELLQGKVTHLNTPNSIYLTESEAKRLFGRKNPLGQSIALNSRDFGRINCQIKGVFANLPRNSDIQFKYLCSLETLANNQTSWADINGWGWGGFQTFVRLKANTKASTVESKITDLIAASPFEGQVEIWLQPLLEMHLYSELISEYIDVNRESGSIRMAQFLTIVALLILIIAWINYVNLSMAQALERGQEVGIRKVMGASNSQLIGQFIVEALIINILALIVALSLIEIILPILNTLFEQSIFITPLYNWQLTLSLIAFFVLGSVVSALYPAWHLANIPTLKALRNVSTQLRFRQRNYLRPALVLFQFIVSIALIMGTTAVYKQLNFMQSKDLGIELNELVVVKAPVVEGKQHRQKLKAYHKRLLNQTHFKSVSITGNIPGQGYNWGAVGFSRLGEQANEEQMFFIYYIDTAFVDTYQARLIAGKTNPVENSGVLINENALKILNFNSPEDAIGQIISFNKERFKIRGVIADYHHLSLKESIYPTIFILQNNYSYFTMRYSGSLERLPEVIKDLEDNYQAQFPNNPFNYFFPNQKFAQQYLNEQLFGKVFIIFACLAIFIACLGLFALVAFRVEKSRKEIGIRKVLGASEANIVWLIARDFLILIGLAISLTLPIAWLGLQVWLENYAYRFPLDLSTFIIPIVIIILVASLTMISQTLNAARRNPVNTLRYE